MIVDDSYTPDYEIEWIDNVTKEKRLLKVFTYGNDKTLAIAAFRLFYPKSEILKIEELMGV